MTEKEIAVEYSIASAILVVLIVIIRVVVARSAKPAAVMVSRIEDSFDPSTITDDDLIDGIEGAAIGGALGHPSGA